MEQLQKALDYQLAPSGSWSHDDYDFVAHLKGQPGLLTSSSQSSHESFSKSWKYDVFISFIGEDTHNTFVDHLYSTLEDRQIITYMDNEPRRHGETISPFHFEAIQESQIAIILFSPNYASSSWCLDELAFIVKNEEEGAQIVVPIFCGVAPLEVINQTGHYGEALAQHELNNNINKVESWREALARAGNLPGWGPWAVVNWHESKVMKRISDDISYKLLSLMSQPKANVEALAKTYLIGMETRTQELLSLPKVGSGGVHMVGICRMWGSGKSTLASSTYDKISHEFDACCFIANVTSESRIHGLKTLQEKILSNVLNSNVMLRSTEQGIYMMERRLCQYSVLVVLDDVNHVDHLMMLAGSKNWFGNGSRIIFTTRNQDLVNAHNGITHNVRMLDDTEAIKLFSRHAFGKSKPLPGFQDVSLNMVSKFGGHPSTLISLGSFLHRKERSVWISILDRLEGIPVDEILKRFKTRDDGVMRNPFDQLLT